MQAVEIHCGDHALIRVGQKLYSFGKNTYGQLLRETGPRTQRRNYDDDAGAESEESRQLRATPTLVECLVDKGAYGCAIGYDHSLALCADGLYIGGRFCGTVHNPPTRIPFFNGRAVRRISSGDCSDHVLVCCDDGLFALGANRCGQLGLGDKHDRESPQEVIEFHDQQVTAIATGYNFSMVICEGALYSFGAAALCGHAGKTDCLVPAKVQFFENYAVHQVACGRRSTLVLCDEGLFHFGQGINCQHVLRLLPQRLDFFANRLVTRMAVGAEHYLVLCDDRALYSFGRNSSGELGHGDVRNATEPKAVTALQSQTLDCVAAGSGVSMVLTEAGELFSFGDAFDGKLGNGASANVSDKPRFTFPGLLPSFTAVLEAAAYKQLRKQPLSLVPGVLTQGTKPPATKEEAERLRRHEAGRQQRVADQRAKLQEEKQQRMAHDKSDKQRKREHDLQRQHEYDRISRERRQQGATGAGPGDEGVEALIRQQVERQLRGAGAGLAGGYTTEAPGPQQTQRLMEQRVQKEVEGRLRQSQFERDDMEGRVRREIEALAREGRAPEAAARGPVRAEEPTRQQLEARIQREIAEHMGRPRAGDGAPGLGALEAGIKREVEERVRAEQALLARQVEEQRRARSPDAAARGGGAAQLAAPGGLLHGTGDAPGPTAATAEPPRKAAAEAGAGPAGDAAGGREANADEAVEGPAERCAACGEAILGNHMDVDGTYYHEECWVCVSCEAPLSAAFVDTPEGPTCEACASAGAVCLGCGQEVEGLEDALQAMGGLWHTRCFVCRECGQPIGPQDMYAEVGGRPVHEGCIPAGAAESPERSGGSAEEAEDAEGAKKKKGKKKKARSPSADKKRKPKKEA